MGIVVRMKVKEEEEFWKLIGGSCLESFCKRPFVSLLPAEQREHKCSPGASSGSPCSNPVSCHDLMMLIVGQHHPAVALLAPSLHSSRALNCCWETTIVH